jgi:lipoprotein NlpD
VAGDLEAAAHFDRGEQALGFSRISGAGAWVRASALLLMLAVAGCASDPGTSSSGRKASSSGASKPAPVSKTRPGLRPRSTEKVARSFVRPVEGEVIARFDGRSNKGTDFAGALGDPVRAADAGTVVYASNGMRGYGQMVIIDHDSTYLTAYAHNSAILVKKGQKVSRGQPIAKMGKTDSDRVKLHFEVRRNSVAVDPEPYISQ